MQPVALTRGYGGRLAGPHWVTPAATRRDVGDEALLLARAAPTLVARDRHAGARAIESGPQPCSVIVMDDGLQNPSLAKDLTIAVVDGSARHRQWPARSPPGRCERRSTSSSGSPMPSSSTAPRPTPPSPSGCGTVSSARCCARP